MRVQLQATDFCVCAASLAVWWLAISVRASPHSRLVARSRIVRMRRRTAGGGLAAVFAHAQSFNGPIATGTCAASLAVWWFAMSVHASPHSPLAVATTLRMCATQPPVAACSRSLAHDARRGGAG